MTEPPARGLPAEEHRKRVERALQMFWRGREGYNIACSEELALEQVVDPTIETLKAVGPSTYGEVTPLGARQIAHAMGIDVRSLDEPIVFMDLGSGVGKLAAQAYLEWPAITRVVGVELSATRAARAAAAWESATIDGDADALRREALGLVGGGSAEAAAGAVQLIHGDIFDADLSEATHIYVASLCFSDAVLSRLAEKLSTSAPQLEVVASLRAFPGGLDGFHCVEKLRAEMSWTLSHGKGETVHVYRRCEGAESD